MTKHKKFIAVMRMLFIFIGLFFFNHSYGQNLSNKDTAEVRFVNSRKFFIYKVNKGETLFSISQKFKIPQEEILQFNKDLEQQNLKVKSKLWIPAYSWLNKNNAVETVKEDEEEKNPEKGVYRIAIVSTLNLAKQYIPDTTSLDSSYVEESLEREIQNNVSFIEGARRSLALLNEKGLKSHLSIIDSEQDTLKLNSRLKLFAPEVIITNENGKELKFLSHYCDSKNIRLVSAGVNTSELIKDSKNSISLFPSSLSQCQEMGYFNAKYFPGAIGIAFKTSESKENERSIAFKTGWKNGGGGKFIYLDYLKGGVGAMADSLSKNKNSIIFVSSSNEALVTTILSKLKESVSDHTITVAGLPTWQYFETIDQNLIDKCNVYIFSSGFIGYGTDKVENFRKYYRDTFNGEPSEYSFQGYDAMLFTGDNVLKLGKKFITSGKTISSIGIYSEYEIDNELKENKIIHVYQPTKDDQIDYFEKIKGK